jgi:uncharacterized protein (DUF2384 family)
MLKIASLDIEQRMRRLEVLKNLDDEVVLAAGRAFKSSPAEAADWLMTAAVTIGDKAPLDLVNLGSGRAAVLKMLERIELIGRGAL